MFMALPAGNAAKNAPASHGAPCGSAARVRPTVEPSVTAVFRCNFHFVAYLLHSPMYFFAMRGRYTA